MRMPLPIDALTERHLAARGCTLDSVPAAGAVVQLRATANLSTGGTSIDRTDEIHPRNAALCVLAAGMVGLDVAGLDVLTPDIGVPFPENGAVIVEVNASPGLRMHSDPDEGAPRDVAGAILDALFPPGASCTIPLVAVAGPGAGDAARLVAHLLREDGRTAGCATRQGVQVDGMLLAGGGATAQPGARLLLAHPAVEAAVLEASTEEVLASGLGFDACDVCVVLGGGPQGRGEAAGGVGAVLVSVVRPGGTVVLDADDAQTLALRGGAASRVVLLSRHDEHAGGPLAPHLAAGGDVATLDGDGAVVLVERGGRTRIAPADPPAHAPRGSAGVPAGVLLAAVAAAAALGVPGATIREGVRSFAL